MGSFSLRQAERCGSSGASSSRDTTLRSTVWPMVAKRAAPEIDRLVFAVHRMARRVAHDELLVALDAVGLVTAGRLDGVIDLLAAGKLTRESAALRHRYAPPGDVDAFLAEWVSAGRLSIRDGRYVASEGLHALMRVIQTARATAAAELWRDHRDTVDDVAAMSAEVLASSGPSPLLDAFANVTLPGHAELRLFALLERLRYLRNDAHAAAWMAAGVSAADMVELTPLWIGQDPRGDEVTMASLGERGLVSGGDLTEHGRSVRDAIEAETNRLSEPAFEVLGERGDRFVDLLRALPSEH